jgi:hypothetical protein
LLRAELDIDDGIIRNVKLTGDFFMYPEETIELIESKLRGAHLLEQNIRGIVTSLLSENVTLIGAEREDIIRVLVGKNLCSSAVMRVYYVWPACPSISLSGTACALNCKHCNRVYLKHMIPATTPERLVKLCKKYRERGAVGVLLSGGCDLQGRLLNLPKFIDAIREVHELGLIIKLHTGLVDTTLASMIADAGVDIASMEFVGDETTIRDIFGLSEITPTDYANTFSNLADAGVPYIAPHIAVGLHLGKLRGEFNALEMLKTACSPSTIAIIVFRPTKNTALAAVSPPSAEAVGLVVRKARILFPHTKLVLGAMRPRSSSRNDPDINVRYNIELAALKTGVDGIEIPSQQILDTMRTEGYRLKWIGAFGVLPIEYEDRVVCEWL